MLADAGSIPAASTNLPIQLNRQLAVFLCLWSLLGELPSVTQKPDIQPDTIRDQFLVSSSQPAHYLAGVLYMILNLLVLFQ